MSPDRRPEVNSEADVLHARKTIVGPGPMGLEIGQTLTEGERQVREYYDLPMDQGPARRPGIAEISAVDTQAKTSGRELIAPEEARERNLQRTFVEVLAHAGLPFETAFQIADIAYDIHRGQMERRALPDEPRPPREKTLEEIAMEKKWERMTPEQREERRRKILSSLKQQPDYDEQNQRSVENFRQGRYYSRDILHYERVNPDNRIPKLRVAETEVPQTES